MLTYAHIRRLFRVLARFRITKLPSDALDWLCRVCVSERKRRIIAPVELPRNPSQVELQCRVVTVESKSWPWLDPLRLLIPGIELD
jgi:hypothetical protein